MRGYVLRRSLLVIPTVLGLAVGVFALAHLAPGDPAVEYARRLSIAGEPTPQEIERAREHLGLDRPVTLQFAGWAADVARGDLGTSFTRDAPVAGLIAARLPATLQVAGAALGLIVVLSVPIGVLAALFHRRWIDHALRATSLAAASVPNYFFAYVLIIVFATTLGLLPVAGREGPTSLILPALAIAVGPTAIVSRLLRASLLETLTQDYMRTALAKGLGRTAALVRHALRNAAIPVITVVGTILGHLLTGAVIAEFIFAWPGLGRLLLEAVFQRDFPLLQGLVLLAGVTFALVNLVVDLSYRLFDPRIRLGARS